MLQGEKLFVRAYQVREQLPIFWRRLIQRFLVLSAFGALIVYVAPLGVAEETPPDPTEIQVPVDPVQEAPNEEVPVSADETFGDEVVSQDSPISSENPLPTESESPGQSQSGTPIEETESARESSSDNSEDENSMQEEEKIDCKKFKEEDEIPEECEVKPAPLLPQPSIRLIAPSSLMVDPRAKLRHLPPLEIDSPAPILACIFGNGTIVDVGQRGVADAIGGKSKFLVMGDLTSTVLLSGENAFQVASFINGTMGLPIYSNSGIVNRGVSLRIVALNKPSVNLSFCNSSLTSRYISFRALDINLFTKKAPIPLTKR